MRANFQLNLSKLGGTTNPAACRKHWGGGFCYFNPYWLFFVPLLYYVPQPHQSLLILLCYFIEQIHSFWTKWSCGGKGRVSEGLCYIRRLLETTAWANFPKTTLISLWRGEPAGYFLQCFLKCMLFISFFFLILLFFFSLLGIPASAPMEDEYCRNSLTYHYVTLRARTITVSPLLGIASNPTFCRSDAGGSKDAQC